MPPPAVGPLAPTLHPPSPTPTHPHPPSPTLAHSHPRPPSPTLSHPHPDQAEMQAEMTRVMQDPMILSLDGVASAVMPSAGHTGTSQPAAAATTSTAAAAAPPPLRPLPRWGRAPLRAPLPSSMRIRWAQGWWAQGWWAQGWWTSLCMWGGCYRHGPTRHSTSQTWRRNERS